MSQSTQIALKRIEMQKKISPYEWFFPLPQNAQILTHQSDLSSNIPTKFDQNPTHSNRDISRKSGSDTHTQTDKIARSQGSQSFTAYTISKDENDFFMKL